LLGKLSIPKVDDVFDEISEEVKKMMKVIELNEIAYTEFIFSIDVKASNGNIAFNIVKGCKTKDYPDGNAASAWEKIKNKDESVSEPSMVKLDKAECQGIAKVKYNTKGQTWVQGCAWKRALSFLFRGNQLKLCKGRQCNIFRLAAG
jgi:hypothetical protein